MHTFSGLWAFALTTFVLSFYNAQVRGVSTPNVVVSLALFTGGLAQFTGGVWEFVVRNTFGGTGAFLRMIANKTTD